MHRPALGTEGEGLTINNGHALAWLQSLPDESVNCIVTSPPYYGLRDYGVDGQIGLEKTPAEYLAKMTSIFREARRVLRKDGTCWVNMGDSYAAQGGDHSVFNSNQPNVGAARCHANGSADKGTRKAPGGYKPKDLMGMPWRLAFALQDDGWYLRSDIIWAKPNPMPESVRDRPTKAHEYIFLLTKSAKYWYDADAIRTVCSEETKQLSYDTMDYKRRDKYKMPDGWDTGEGGHGLFHSNGREKGKNVESGQRTKVDLNANWDASEEAGTVKGANARTVWTIPTVGFPKAHFATFPPEIPRRCILAGCPPGGVVLDMFAGSGTTGAVAIQLGRTAWLNELNPDYCELIRERCSSVTPGFNFGEVPQCTP